MTAWKKATLADKLEFLADGNGEFAKAIDLASTARATGLGHRARGAIHAGRRRVVKTLNIEGRPQGRGVRGDTLLKQL